MNKVISILSILVIIPLLMPSAFAGTTEVNWGDYKKFRDIDSGNENRKSFRERTFKEFESHFAKLAEKLPEKQVLKFDVTDVDLAGDTRIASVNQTRIVKDLYFPRLNFSYELIDEKGHTLKADTIVLKDMSFMSGSQLKYRNKLLGYEKKMLDKWFKDTFSNLIVITK
jgi:hypothetical protein